MKRLGKEKEQSNREMKEFICGAMPDNFFSASRCRVFTYYDSYVQQLALFEKKEGDRLKEKSIHSFRRKPNVLHVGNLSTKPGVSVKSNLSDAKSSLLYLSILQDSQSYSILSS
ncbi:hypothetical protein OUZ56_008296 [Daphnia magna]|uniref:Uncharacterized protein n=1 Tax=Daphnia magna TaxID=35525 RepID=A0ABR0ACJ8_9CRUS|nr:hypothetical protein OUZ56_008296 [Daphnia magna]